MIQLGDPAPTIPYVDADGHKRRLADHWASGPTLLVFLRHFG